ncbi:atypical dual specificity phosphatase [Sarotherodon galilaeus]
MALMKFLNNRPDTPYFRPPPLYFRVLKSCDQLRSLMFEEFASKVQQRGCYIMRGHELRGTAPPNNINVTARTQFFRAPILSVSEDLFTEAEALLHPHAPLTPLKMSSPNEGLVTVQGEVAEFSAVKDVLSGKQHVPLRNLQLKEDGYAMSVCLRREAGIHSFNVGDQINLSHMKLNHSSYGPQLHSTTYTKTETKVEDRAEVLIIGVATSEKPKQLEVLLDDGESLFIDSELWNPFDKELEEVAVRVTVQIKGKQIMQIKKNQCE